MSSTLAALLSGYPDAFQIEGNKLLVPKTLAFDSRADVAEGCFVAVKGTVSDGHQFIDKAVEKGASIIVAQTPRPAQIAAEVTWVQVTDSALALAILAANFYGNPSKKLQLVGITGTNGKTTTATLLHQLFTNLGFQCGLIGTVEVRIGSEVMPSTHTTPDALKVQFILTEMLGKGCTHVFMEVSSHGIDQKRVAGLHFTGGVFTNLTHDHLDYHVTFKAYLEAKKLFFDHLPKTAFALYNADDRNGKIMMQNTKATKKTYALKKTANFKAKILENSLLGLHLELNGQQIHARLMGVFNAYNLCCAYSVASLLGADESAVLVALSGLKGAVGRFETFAHPTLNHCIGIVDYAHTPDALEKVLETIKEFKRPSDTVITVVGCGGNRDKTKRPIMAAIAARMSQQLILTSDNPRTENPEDILKDMEAGLNAEQLNRTLTIENREQAIKTASRMAKPGTIILVAGKGHEDYQEIMGVKHPFDDREMLKKYFA